MKSSSNSSPLGDLAALREKKSRALEEESSRQAAKTQRYRAYPEYKNSSIPWLGLVPEHWKPLRFKHVLAEKKRTLNPSLPAGSISFGNVIFKNSETLSSETKETYQEVLNGEFLVNPLNMNYDLLSLRTALSTIDVVVSTGYIVLNCSNTLAKRYVKWLLQEFDVAHMKTLGSGVRQTINYSDIGNSFFLQPNFSEQQKIADFLDYETAKIDLLIEKQQLLIELLKEKRQAVISHAVTKGLNPNVSLKPSGVEWLGDVPKHWEVKRLKQAIESGSSISYGIVQPGDPIDIGIPFVQTTNMSKGTLGLEDLQKTTAEIANRYPRSTLKGGEVILGIRATIGAAFVVPDHLCGANLSRGVARIAPDQTLNPAFLATFLGSDHVKRYWELSKQGSTFSEVSIETVREISIPVPPFAEQVQISRSIKARTRILDNLIEMAESKTTLLQERRTALISAAVTGKIDVRDWQAPASTKREGTVGTLHKKS